MQNLGQIRSNIVKKSKETSIINRFFSCFAWHGQCILKLEVVAIQTHLSGNLKPIYLEMPATSLLGIFPSTFLQPVNSSKNSILN